MSRPHVFFDVTIGGQPAGRIEFEVVFFEFSYCSSSTILFLRLPRTSAVCALERRERGKRVSISATRTQSSIESSPSSCFREETLLFAY